jgi:beta-glucosidase
MVKLKRLGLVAAALVTMATGCAKGPAPLAAQQAGGQARAASAQPFATGFLWGVATAGYQVEGGDTTSNWAAWDRAGRGKHKIGQAIDFWNRYEEDLDLAKGMGLNSFRLSLEWSRIEPRRGEIDPAAVKHYHDVLDAVRARGMEPVVTVSHFAYPAWLDQAGQTAWETDAMPEALARYAGFLAKEYGPKVRWWLTLNEPNTLGPAAYLVGMHPPGKHDPLAYMRVMSHQVEAHKLAYTAIHANDPDARVSLNPIAIHRPEGQSAYGYHVQASTYRDETAILDEMAPVLEDGRPAPGAKRYVDYVAFNYFFALNLLDYRKIPTYDRWPVYPEGLYEVSKKLHARYGLPLMIAENGMATKGDNPRPDGWTREAYLVNHLAQLRRAVAEGVPVVGYMHWSLADNYEWGTYEHRLGLYGIDRRDPELRRFKTPAVDVYGAIARANGLPAALLTRYLGKRN